jgi:hypothetical protein
LEIIAAHPSGCTEALAADNIPADVLIEPSGLALARVESVLDEHGFLEVTTLWIVRREAARMLAHARNS